LDVDVIQTNNLAAHLREFPDNTSKVYYDGKVLTITDEFATGHMQQRIVYREAAGSGRLERLKAKFPGYAVELV